MESLCPECGDALDILFPDTPDESGECPTCGYSSAALRQHYHTQHRLRSTLTTDPPQYCPECGYHFTVYQAEANASCPNGCY